MDISITHLSGTPQSRHHHCTVFQPTPANCTPPPQQFSKKKIPRFIWFIYYLSIYLQNFVTRTQMKALRCIAIIINFIILEVPLIEAVLMVCSYHLKGNAKPIFFLNFLCEDLHTIQCNQYVWDVTFAFAFGWCEITLTPTSPVKDQVDKRDHGWEYTYLNQAELYFSSIQYYMVSL